MGFTSKKSKAEKKKKATDSAGSNRFAHTRECKDIKELYEVGKELGAGGFSVVKKGTDKNDGSLWALKLIEKKMYNNHQEQTEEEVDLLARLEHKNITMLKEVVETPKKFVIVLEMMTGGELFDRIVAREKYNEQDAKEVASKLLEVLQYLHERKIAHRDLKPENLLFDTPDESANLKLTDFGFAIDLSKTKDGKTTTMCGTPEYVAPEVLEGKAYDCKADMWSFGVILYILLCGYPPFYGDSDGELFGDIKSANFSFDPDFWSGISGDAKDLITRLLVVKPKKRLSAEAAYKHHWFQGDHSEGDLAKTMSQLKRYNAVRKFRRAVNVIAAGKHIEQLMAQEAQAS